MSSDGAGTSSGTVRACFTAAAEGFVSVVSSVSGVSSAGGDGRPGDAWARPGLGEWTVRDLVGHTSRALSTIEAYLADPADPPDEIVLRDPVEYLLAVPRFPQGGAAIAERGRQAGAALGDDPAAAVRALASRVMGLVAGTADEAPVRLPLGGATLLAYLPTRTFELTVHSLDVARALSMGPPAVLATPVAACLELAAAVASRRGDGPAVLLALTGRGALPDDFSILS